jgi:hypothetical protein
MYSELRWSHLSGDEKSGLATYCPFSYSFEFMNTWRRTSTLYGMILIKNSHKLIYVIFKKLSHVSTLISESF